MTLEQIQVFISNMIRPWFGKYNLDYIRYVYLPSKDRHIVEVSPSMEVSDKRNIYEDNKLSFQILKENGVCGGPITLVSSPNPSWNMEDEKVIFEKCIVEVPKDLEIKQFNYVIGGPGSGKSSFCRVLPDVKNVFPHYTVEKNIDFDLLEYSILTNKELFSYFEGCYFENFNKFVRKGNAVYGEFIEQYATSYSKHDNDLTRLVPLRKFPDYLVRLLSYFYPLTNDLSFEKNGELIIIDDFDTSFNTEFTLAALRFVKGLAMKCNKKLLIAFKNVNEDVFRRNIELNGRSQIILLRNNKVSKVSSDCSIWKESSINSNSTWFFCTNFERNATKYILKKCRLIKDGDGDFRLRCSGYYPGIEVHSGYIKFQPVSNSDQFDSISDKLTETDVWGIFYLLEKFLINSNYGSIVDEMDYCIEDDIHLSCRVSMCINNAAPSIEITPNDTNYPSVFNLKRLKIHVDLTSNGVSSIALNEWNLKLATSSCSFNKEREIMISFTRFTVEDIANYFNTLINEIDYGPSFY